MRYILLLTTKRGFDFSISVIFVKSGCDLFKLDLFWVKFLLFDALDFWFEVIFFTRQLLSLFFSISRSSWLGQLVILFLQFCRTSKVKRLVVGSKWANFIWFSREQPHIIVTIFGANKRICLIELQIACLLIVRTDLNNA